MRDPGTQPGGGQKTPLIFFQSAECATTNEKNNFPIFNLRDMVVLVLEISQFFDEF